MSNDMLVTHGENALSDRKRQILHTAIEIIAKEGYRALTMRGLARANGMQLGALQYHFRTWDDLLAALAAYLSDVYQRSFESLELAEEVPSLKGVVRVAISDPEEIRGLGDALFTQLWAMARVEPLIDEKLHAFYAEYVERIAERLAALGSRAPLVDALVVASLVEGSVLFVGSERPWASDAAAVQDAIMEFLETRYDRQN